MGSVIFYYSTVLIQIYFVQLIYSFYENDGELNDNKYFIHIEIQCNMQFFTLNILIYISGIIGSTTFSQHEILIE